MSIAYRVQPNPGRPEQIKLFVRCASDGQAEALLRALRGRFGKVSNLLTSFDSAFSHVFFVTTSAEECITAWPVLAAAVSQATAAPSASAGTPAASRPASPLADLAAWDRRLRAAVRRINTEIPLQSAATQEISLGWVVEQVRAGNADTVEALLGQPLISPTSALRAQIALFSETSQHERLIALVESRRREVLALPTSGLLAEQIVNAYLAFGRANAVEDAFHSAQRIAQALLPELERLHQAEGVRELLRQGLGPITPPPEAVAPTLSEQLAGIIQVAPAAQIAPLEALRAAHASSVEVHLALGSAYAAAGQVETALAVYASTTPRDDVERAEVLRRHAELLVAAGRYREAVEQLPYADDMPPAVAALRGAALYWLDRLGEARELLEQAWHTGERRRTLLLPLARSRVASGQDERALHPYRLLLDNAPELLEPEDLAPLATGLYLDRPDDISATQIANLCDRYVQQGGPATRPAQEVTDILHLRAELWAGADRERWLDAQADQMEWLASRRHVEELRAELDALRGAVQRGHLERREHFELLEGLEVAALDDAGVRAALAGEYQSICTAEIDAALLRNEPIPAFVQALQRSLHFLDRTAADFIAEYIADERAQLATRKLEATEQIFAPEQSVSLAKLRLTIIGGHVAMRREVERDLCERHGLVGYDEVAPSSEGHIDRDLVRKHTAGRDLVVVIAGYTGHDLTNHVRDLQRAGDLPGHVIWSRCRGKSGVIREILDSLQ